MNIIESNSFWKRFTPWKDFIMTENVNNNAGASEYKEKFLCKIKIKVEKFIEAKIFWYAKMWNVSI